MPALTTIKLRRGLAAQWTSVNPVLADGEVGFETDSRKFKFGNGTQNWNAVPYASAGGLEGGGFFVGETPPVGVNVGDIWYNNSDTGEEAGRSFIYYDGYWVELNPGQLGPKGDTGASGPANTLTVGTVTTLAPGELATVEITGTAPNQTVNFGVPAGEQGAQGPAGADGEAYGNIDGGQANTNYGGTVTVVQGGNAGSF